MAQDFHGAKVALFIGDQILTILRDDIPTIAFPNMWDFPGGGREDGETPMDTLLREVREEVGLVIPPSAFVWQRRYAAVFDPTKRVWFFVAKMPAGTEADIVFGDEGQCWKLMALPDFLALENVVPSYASRITDWQATLADE